MAVAAWLGSARRCNAGHGRHGYRFLFCRQQWRRVFNPAQAGRSSEMVAKKKDTGTIELTRLSEQELEIPIVGTAPVIPHKWSEKSIRMMPGHPEKEKVKTKKEDRDPETEADACLYKLKGNRLAIPATAFKAAMVGACRFFEKPSMVEAKQMFFVVGEVDESGDQLVPITGEKTLREDTPRNSNGNADLRYRYAIKNWTATLNVRFVPEIISPESIVSLVDAAGRGGVGDWRPSAPKSYTGTFGTWRVDDGTSKPAKRRKSRA
jgi:hypothetical protein